MDVNARLALAIATFRAADDAWQAEINRTLPGVVNARYLPAGKGQPGTKLRRLYAARTAAANEHHAAWEATRAADRATT